MGLQMTLPKEMNHLYTDFENAYWSIDSLMYDTKQTAALLNCYPSREAKIRKGQEVSGHLGFGGTREDHVNPILYSWQALFRTSDIFPNGIPLDENEQKTAVYNFIKAYTGLSFEDVFEA